MGIQRDLLLTLLLSILLCTDLLFMCTGIQHGINGVYGETDFGSTIKLHEQSTNVRMQNAHDHIKTSHDHITKAHAHKSSANMDNLLITITSTNQLATVLINEKNVLNVSKEGLHFVVLHPNTGRVMAHRNLNTGIFGASQEVHLVLGSLTRGRILVILTKGDAALNLSNTSRQALTNFGVTSAANLSYCDTLLWAGTIGGSVLAEVTTSYSKEKSIMHYGQERVNQNVLQSLKVEILIPVVELGDLISCHDNPEEARAKFCSLYDGYGDLCSCSDPAPLVYYSTELEDSVIKDVPLLVIASNRPTYLYRSLVTVLEQRGSSLERIMVVVDGYNQEVRDLLKLLQVPFVEHMAQGISPSARISNHYQFALTTVFSRFPNADRAIVLEEDLFVAPDFFSYFNQTSHLLGIDSSLLCISAWNDLGGLHLARDPAQLYRVETLPGLGWMLTRKLAMELIPLWPNSQQEHDWDTWIRSPAILAGRECVVPDVSRTFHFGISGTHEQGIMQAAHFAGHPVPTQSYNRLREVERLTLKSYEDLIYSLFEDVLFLNSTQWTCESQFFPKSVNTTVIIFIEMTSSLDFWAWKKLARCLGLWDMDTRAQHRGLFRFHFYGTPVLIIGYPYSDYSYIKPHWIQELQVGSNLELEKLEERLLSPRNRARFPVPWLEVHAPPLLTDYPRFPP